MAQCTGCGAALAPSAQWCTQCYLPVTGAAPRAPAGVPDAPSIMSGTWQQSASAGPTPMIQTRWKKTPTTFGPVGRVVCTVLLFLPLPLMIAWTVISGGLGIIGLGAWAGVVMPMALRDVWKAGSLPAG
ncbi:MAG TPA: hypothetical protein VG650_08090 [Mycobacteriales bacterium]|nr:hypothetical protein [Mycobacteriales bacterium]